MAIETVLFDYSGVLTTGLSLPEGDVPFDRDLLMVEMVAALASSDPHPWHELERGELPLVDYVAYVESRVPGAGCLFAADSELNVMAGLSILEDRLVVVRQVREQGLRVGLVTNNVAEWKRHWFPKLPPRLFEVVIDSADVGCRKPEPKIYEHAMSEMQIDDPSTVLFVDDFEWNVEGATAVGMIGLHCTATTDLSEAIANLRLSG